MGRKVFLVDGFNLYYSIADDKILNANKWLDIRKLCECFKFSDRKEKIVYFTALTNWSPDKVRRHQNLIKIYRDLNIEIVLGEFRRKNKKCRNCNRYFDTFEEKRPDVNIAIKLFELAYLDLFDTAIIISGDSDLIPAISTVKRIFPIKKVGIMIPFNRKAEELKAVCDFHYKIKMKHLNQSILTDPYILKDGTILGCPSSWK